MEQRAEPIVQQAHWAGERPAMDAAGGQHQALRGGPGLADQLLAAQLQALQLGALHPPRHGTSTYSVPAGLAAAAAAAAARSSSPGSGGHSSPQQFDHALLASSDLLARLHMAATAPGLSGVGGLPPSSGGAALTQATAAALQQRQQQHSLGPRPAGRRRGTSSSGGRRNEEKVRRTVYISDISDAVSEAQLAAFFQDCGQLVDCRVCGDPNSSMRFAFIEFLSEEAAGTALARSGSLLGDFPIRVSPSKTAIVPVNNTYLPRSNEERELVARTVFVGNVDRVVEREQLRDFFQNLCGSVSKIRLLGDSQHNSKIAFIEFQTAESARAALKLSGALLGTLPLRVSPSKTPVRQDSRRSEVHAPTPTPLPPTPSPVAHHHSTLPPALLMAVAGLQMMPQHYHS